MIEAERPVMHMPLLTRQTNRVGRRVSIGGDGPGIERCCLLVRSVAGGMFSSVGLGDWKRRGELSESILDS